jgi:sulfur carrier protein
MKIFVNGELKEFEDETNIKTLMEVLGYEKDAGAAAVNMTFVAIDKYEETLLHEGDEVEILAPVYGG